MIDINNNKYIFFSIEILLLFFEKGKLSSQQTTRTMLMPSLCSVAPYSVPITPSRHPVRDGLLARSHQENLIEESYIFIFPFCDVVQREYAYIFRHFFVFFDVVVNDDMGSSHLHISLSLTTDRRLRRKCLHRPFNLLSITQY